jgi:hypothetical protein
MEDERGKKKEERRVLAVELVSCRFQERNASILKK